MSSMVRGYLTVNGRRVHYRRMGEGPPVVMLHGSPGDSAMLEEEMHAASQAFTCFALDTPGFGGSDPLRGETMTVRDLAQATAEAMAALQLPPCRVYGTHTGAAIGVELGVGWPEQVSGLVLEGLPAFTEREISLFFEGYFAPLVVDPLGGHFTSTWVRFRDQFTWFPWVSRHVSRLNPVDRPTPEEIDHWVSMFYRSCKTYGPAYRAACYYGQAAITAAAALERPCVFMASAEDMLFPHLDRLRPLREGQRIERLAYDPPAKFAAIARFLDGLPGGSDGAPIKAQAALCGVDPAVGFIGGPDSQVFVRAYGDPDKPAVILLHDAPGTGLALQGLARGLAADAYVLVPDLPGVGETPALPTDRPILGAAADAIGAVADGLGLAQFRIGAIGLGCAPAAVFAARGDERLVALMLEAPVAPSAALAEAIAPDLALTPEGSHWLKAWLMLRDNEIYQPWFDGRVAAQRKVQGDFDGGWLHDQTVALMKSRTTYARLPRAAALFDVGEALTSATVAVNLAQSGDLATLIISNLR